jgi:hypothetical protein
MFTILKQCQYMCDGKLQPVTESVRKLQTDNTSMMVS